MNKVQPSFKESKEEPLKPQY